MLRNVTEKDLERTSVLRDPGACRDKLILKVSNAFTVYRPGYDCSRRKSN